VDAFIASMLTPDGLTEPCMLMLDEPSLGIAPMINAQIVRAISQLAAQGPSVLLVEQNARAALRISTHGYVIEGGRIALEGSAEVLSRDEAVLKSYLGLAASGAGH
jgi:branched-chain amino acid transport system ATP-binding protein